VPWNPSEDQLGDLKTLWCVDGLSAGQIAGRFGQTRNVIIGIVHRRGWSKPGNVAPRQQRTHFKRAPKLPAPVAIAPPKKQALNLDPTKFVRFDQLGPHHCRYPVDRGSDHAGMYCGALPNGSPYCDGHAEIVYQPHQPRKKRRPFKR
jgi:hypothetical protein